jgi:arylsulfatase A
MTVKNAVFGQMLAAVCLLLSACNNENNENSSRPNIVYILADDMGYGDVEAYNPASRIATPHLNKLASEGMRFTDAHSPSSVCTPTRYSILTGRYPWRSRKPVGVLRGYSRTLLEQDRPTIGKLLQKHGYETAIVGKWHLGLDWTVKATQQNLLSQEGYGITEEMSPDDIDFDGPVTGGPNTAGFDYSFILPASLDMPPYCYLENQRLTDKLSGYTEGNSLESGYTGPFWRPGKTGSTFDFMEVLPTFVRKANEFIDRQNAQRPFFLYLPLTGPHTPWLPDSVHSGKSKVGMYGDFVQQVDAAVGDVLAQLKAKGFEENTIVVFASDNGPFWREQHVAEFGHRAAGPFRGMKADAYEGGHRIPFIVRWPGKVKEGAVSHATTTLTNLLATCAELLGETGEEFVPEDSYSILPVLFGESERVPGQKAVVHSASNGYFAVREGAWKLILGLGSGGFTLPKELEPAPGQRAGQLFNLTDDPGETTNLYESHPEKVAELTETLDGIRKATQKIVSP